ncbi:peptidoglycan editing factor PgeF [Kangiella sp. TOML190]|uniref:peptidoglycan editing factor PgeF n=1 Tax=Kangiella sp. TOML190 TaxID=2931351 RepID=UPI00203F5F5E|nr:peptidoglycan editing factor PgeF [Kangiella sp. TOML190]
MSNTLEVISPNWPAPSKIKAFSTYRQGGVSDKPFDGLNLAQHVNDESQSVAANRQLLEQRLEHPQAPHWLTQTHSTTVVQYQDSNINCEADGVFSRQAGQACVVMTADCLPVLLCSKQADFVAAVHAGWRGMAEGILLNALKLFQEPRQLMAWIGPAISQQHFEVGAEVKALFGQANQDFAAFFEASNHDRFLADLPAIAQLQLEQQGVEVYQSGLCTYANPKQFFSYRRDGETGRMASMIWIEDEHG